MKIQTTTFVSLVSLASFACGPKTAPSAHASSVGSVPQSAVHFRSSGARFDSLDELSDDAAPLCPDLGDGQVRCSAWERLNDQGDRFAAASAAGAGFSAADLVSAYRIPQTTVTATIAIVDAYDYPDAESDLAVYRSEFSLPPCTTANGCFTKVNQNGKTSPLPVVDLGWGGEITLDIEMASAGCPSCKTLLVEANSTSADDLASSVNSAVRLGATVVSNSYYGGEPSTEDSAYNHPGVAIFASTGDAGYGVAYPASSAFVTAVGGTSLRASHSARGWTETAWRKGGSGCSQHFAKPAWQKDTGCAKRMEADVSAVADTHTPVAVYFDGAWSSAGGTSVASPLVAAIYAQTGYGAATPELSYRHPQGLYDGLAGAFNDVTSGTNGTCSQDYFCTGGVGYDGPTGNGSPNGTALLALANGAPDTVQVRTLYGAYGEIAHDGSLIVVNKGLPLDPTSIAAIDIASPATVTSPYGRCPVDFQATLDVPPDQLATLQSQFPAGYDDFGISIECDTTNGTILSFTSFPLPIHLTISGTTTAVQLSWTADADATHYRVLRDGATIASSVTATTYADHNAEDGHNHVYAVVASNGDVSNQVDFNFPILLTVTGSTTAAQLSWTADANAARYNVVRDGATIASSLTATRFTDATAVDGHNHVYVVVANNGDVSNQADFTIPMFLTVSGITSVNLSWTAETEAASYFVTRDGVIIAASLTATTYIDYAAADGQAHVYGVIANNGDLSNQVTFTLPMYLTVTGTTSAVLRWTADPTASSYYVLRDGIVAASPLTSPTYTDTHSDGQAHVYMAVSSTGHVSNEVTFTTWPIHLIVIGTGAADLLWTADASAANYTIVRDGVAIITLTSRNYQDAAPLDTSPHVYRVLADNGDFSNTVSFTGVPLSTPPPPPGSGCAADTDCATGSFCSVLDINATSRGCEPLACAGNYYYTATGCQLNNAATACRLTGCLDAGEQCVNQFDGSDFCAYDLSIINSGSPAAIAQTASSFTIDLGTPQSVSNLTITGNPLSTAFAETQNVTLRFRASASDAWQTVGLLNWYGPVTTVPINQTVEAFWLQHDDSSALALDNVQVQP